VEHIYATNTDYLPIGGHLIVGNRDVTLQFSLASSYSTVTRFGYFRTYYRGKFIGFP
jgi:hypothetical protein